MQYIIKPTKYEKNKWVVAKDDIPKEDIKRIILNSDFFVSDLDDSIAHSPTKKFVKWDFFYNPMTMLWGIISLFKIAKMGRKNRFEIWQHYFTRFDKDLERNGGVSMEKAHKRLYPGIAEFFDYLNKNCPHQKQVLVTRTDKRIGMPYEYLLGFDKAYYREFGKYKVIEELISSHTPKIITIAGDSEEDKEMIDTAKKSKIEYCLGINVVKSIKKVNEEFDINIGRNWKGLQEIINGY
nr:hypothetical protein [uncultured archaeon]